MKILITRPVVITGNGGTRSFVPGLTVDVDETAARQILTAQAGIPAEPEAATPAADVTVAPRHRKATHAQT